MQQNIDFGTFPDDPDADAIRTAFQKVQTNFDELFDVTAGAAVNSVNRTPGIGIQVNSPTGNVVVSANIATIPMDTSTLRLRLENGLPGANGVIITGPGRTVFVDLPNSIFTDNFTASGWANVTGNVIGGNINTNGQVVASGNVTGSNLNTTGIANVIGNVIGG